MPWELYGDEKISILCLRLTSLKIPHKTKCMSWGVLFKGLGVQKDSQLTPCWLRPCLRTYPSIDAVRRLLPSTRRAVIPWVWPGSMIFIHSKVRRLHSRTVLSYDPEYLNLQYTHGRIMCIQWKNLTHLLLVANSINRKWCEKSWKMAKTLANGYSSDRKSFPMNTKMAGLKRFLCFWWK